MVELKKYINRKKVPKKENPNKIVHVVQKVLNFNKHQIGKGFQHILALRPSELTPVAKVSERDVADRKLIKILTPKQMLQRLPIALAQVKAGNTSKNLLNEIKKSYTLRIE